MKPPRARLPLVSTESSLFVSHAGRPYSAHFWLTALSWAIASMDPTTAIGVAAGILQFACFSAKAIATIREVAKAGSTAGNAHTLLLTKDLQHVAGQLDTTCDLGSSDHALALKEIVADCEQSCVKLTELLTALSMGTTTLQTANSKEPTAKARWNLRGRLGFKKIEIGIKSIWKKEEIEELEMRIAKSRDQVMLRLQTLLV